MAKRYIRFHYTFSHGGLWLISIADLTILFSHGRRTVAKSISDFTILLATAALWLKGISDLTIPFSHSRRSVAKSISDFTILLATAFGG